MADQDNPFAAIPADAQPQVQAQPAPDDSGANPFASIPAAQPQQQSNPFQSVMDFFKPHPTGKPPLTTTLDPIEAARQGYGIFPDIQAPVYDARMTGALDNSFKQGLYNQQLTPEQQGDMADHPVVSALGQGIGSLIKLTVVGAAVAPIAAGGAATAMLGDASISLMPWIQGAANAGSGAATFGISSILDKLSKSLQGGNVTTDDLKDVAGQTAFGGGFGVTQAIPKAAARITAQGLYMAGAAKLGGATDVSSVVQGFVGALFGLSNRVDLNNAYRREAADKVSETLATKLNEFGMPMDKAVRTSDTLMSGYHIDDPVKPNGEGLKQPTLDYFQDLNDKIKDLKLNTKPLLPPGSPIMADQYGATPDKPLNEGPVSSFAPATVDTIGAAGKKTSEPVQPLEGVERTEHLTRVQSALDIIQEKENQKAADLTEKGIPTNPIQVPPAQNLDKVLQDRLLSVSKKELSTPEGNDQSVQKAILKEMHRDETGELDKETERPLSAITMNQNKEDAGKTPIFDWRNLSHVTVDDLAQQIKNENVLRQSKGMPLIDPNMDIVVSKHTYDGQEKGIENKIRQAILLSYSRAKVQPADETPPVTPVADSSNPFTDIPPATPNNPIIIPYQVEENNPFKAIQAANVAGKKAQDNLSTSNGSSTVPNGVENQSPTGINAVGHVNNAVGINNSSSLDVKNEQIEQKLPKAEHILHDIDQIEAHNARIVVKDLKEVEALLNVVRLLDKQLVGKTYEEAQEMISQAAGISVPKVKALLKESIKADVRNTEAALQNAGVAHRQDSEEQLREAMQLLQDWDESRSQRNLPQPKAFEGKSNADLREKGVDGVDPQNLIKGMSITEKEIKLKEQKTKEAAARFFDKGVDQLTSEEMQDFKKSKASQFFKDKQDRQRTNAMKAQVIAHHGVYDKLYIDEINGLIDRLKEGSVARRTVEEAMSNIHKLISDGTKEVSGHTVYKTLIDNSHIKFAMNQLRDAVREAEQVTARARQKLEEASGYENLSKEEVDAAASEHPDDREAKEPTSPDEHDSEITFDNRMDVEDKPFSEDGEDLMYTADPIKMMKDAFTPPVKVYKYGQEARECSTPALLAFLRQNPTLAKLDDWFTFKMGGDKAMEVKALQLKERYSSGEAKDAVQHFAMYEGAIEGIIRSDLQPLYDDLEKNVKDFMKNHPLGIKADKPGLQKIIDKYSSLLAEASEQVMVRSYDPHSYAYSELGHGPHKDAFEKDAYVKAMKEWYDFFKKPYGPADLIRWQTQRTPDLWNLLKDQSVMSSDKLQRIVLFYKAQIEMPLLLEQVKNGIFSNSDIWKSIVEGYHMKNFALKGEQSDLAGNIKNFFLPKSPLGNIKMPTAKYSSQQAFKSAGATDSWVPINDFFTDNGEYMKRAMLSIKQAQLLKEISKLPLPKLEFFSPNFVKALADHPLSKSIVDQGLKKVHSSTDKVIIDIANHMTHAMFSPAEIAKGLDIEKQTGKNPYAVTPMTVLTEGGWVQSHQDDGLNKWYRGSFAPPFVYKTLYDMIQTVFRTATGFDTLPGIVQVYMTGKQMLLIDPLVHVPQYIGNTIMDMPLHQVPGAMISLPVKSFVYFFKGLVKTGPEILAGEHTQDVGTTPEERQWARGFTERGATMVGGYNLFLHNMIGKSDKGMFPQRQEFGDRLRDYLLSGFGTGPSVLGEMIGQHALKVMIAMTKEYIAQGIDPEKAMRMTVYRCNTAMNNLNQVSWQGSRLGAFLSVATYSKNFAVGATRMMMMASQTPVGGAVMGGLMGGAAGGIVGAAVGGTVGARIAAANKFKYKSGAGAGRNVFTGADIPEDFRDQLNGDMLKGVSMMLFWTAMFYGVTQFALYNMQKEEDKNPGEEFWWNNPVPLVGSVNLFMKNVNDQPLYATYNAFRLGKDMADQLSPLINAAGKNMTGNKDFNLGGKGPVKYTADKFGAAFSYIEALVNNKFLTDGAKVWDSDEKTQWKQAAEAASYIAGKNVPINPWIGGSATNAPLSDDKFINMLMESATLYGVQYHAGAQTNSGVSEEESQQWKSDVRHEDYVEKSGTNPFANFNGGRNLNSPEAVLKARENGEITQRQYVNFFKKQNPSNYFKANRRKIFAAEQEDESTPNPFAQIVDAIENPENH